MYLSPSIPPDPQRPQNEINLIPFSKKFTVCKKPSSDLPMFWKLQGKRIRELLLFYLFSLLNESTVPQGVFGTFFKNLTSSSDVSNSSLTHFPSFLSAFSKSVPYCWNLPGSFKETTFEGSKTSCFCDRVLLRFTESIFQLLYIIYILPSPIFQKWLV